MKKILITTHNIEDLFTVIDYLIRNDSNFTYEPFKYDGGIVMDIVDEYTTESVRKSLSELCFCKVEEIEEAEKHHIFLVTHTFPNENDSIPQEAYNTLEEAKAYVDSETTWAKQDKSFDVYAPTKKSCNTTFVYHLDKQGFATLYEKYDIKEMTVNQ